LATDRQLCRSGAVTAPFSQASACQDCLAEDADLRELIRNPPYSSSVLMSRIVKRMNQDGDRSSLQDSPSIDVPNALLVVDPFGPSLRRTSRARWLSRARANQHDCLADSGNPKVLAFARGQKQSRLIAAPITRVSNRAAATFNIEQFGCAVLSTSAAPQSARTGCLLLNSMEVSALRFNDVDVQIGNIVVACAQALGRTLAGIGSSASVCDLIATTMRQRERRVAATDGR
jgi:hypothetical protein